MNEQLVVKNFGPIKDATVDFKRVTVFIGPTGGGKSTLAKLKDIFLYRRNFLVDSSDNYSHPRFDSLEAYNDHDLGKHFSSKSVIKYESDSASIKYSRKKHYVGTKNISPPPIIPNELLASVIDRARQANELQKSGESFEGIKQQLLTDVEEILIELQHLESSDRYNRYFPVLIAPVKPWYCPSERIFISALSYSWTGFLRDDIGIPKNILDFANSFSNARKDIHELKIPFLKDVSYIHRDGQDFIRISSNKVLLKLYEAASGVQSTTPLLVLIEFLSRNTEQAQSFIIEEPELNLYPTAQQGLLNWLVEKCTKGENDLTITTHSPYLLAHFNTLLFAYQVAQNHPERAEEIAKIVPRESWINPAEFAAYHVEGQQENGVRSIVNPETGLISYNGLDAIASAEAGDFEKLLDINAGLAVEW